jgi:mannosyl-glycoprotein endo-beta-N-acetylglucosaminidase
VSLALATLVAGRAQAATTVNLALGKTAVGSFPCTPLSTASKAVDGRTSNIFTDKWCTLALGIKWMQVDLRSPSQLSSFVVKHAGVGGESPAYNTRDFNIQTSLDGMNFNTQAVVLGNTASVSTVPVSVTARFVRLNVTRPTQGFNDAARIYEFEVWGASS